jgi:restriction system protein
VREEVSRTRTRNKHVTWWQKPSNLFVALMIFIAVASSPEGARLIGQAFTFLLIVGLVYGFYYLFLRKGKFTRVKDLYEVDGMDGLDFEHYLVPLFEKLGYRAEVTKGSGDFGADLILHKRGKKYVVQAKRYSSSIGVSAVQQVVGAIRYYKAQGAMVVTNNYFTPAAEDLAKHNKVRLIDRDELSYMIGNLQRNRFRFLR